MLGCGDWEEVCVCSRAVVRNACSFTEKKHPPMPFDEFCGRFFLDSQGGTEFAEAYGLQLIRDDQQNTYVTISVSLSLSGGLQR